MKNNISFFLGLLFVSCVQNIIHPSVKKYFKPALKSSCTLEDKKIIFLKKEPLPLNFFPSKMSHFNGKMSHKYFKRYKRKGNEDHKEGASNTINKNFSVHYPGFISRVFAFEWKSTIPRFMMRNFSCLRERYIIYFYLAFDLLREECFRKYTLLNQLNQAFEKNRFFR